jgi:Ca2+-binding EF-hand superfamily protein
LKGAPMLTDLQTRKLTRMFNTYDADHSGSLEFADFEAQFNNLAQMRGIASDSPEYDQLQSGYRAAWDQIRQFADPDRDERVTLDEWLAYCSEVVQSPDKFEQGMGSIARLNAKLLDHDGDGLISLDELVAFRATLDTDKEAIFKQFDLDGDGYMSGDELVELFRQFFLSDDPNAPGNIWYGAV